VDGYLRRPDGRRRNDIAVVVRWWCFVSNQQITGAHSPYQPQDSDESPDGADSRLHMNNRHGQVEDSTTGNSETSLSTTSEGSAKSQLPRDKRRVPISTTPGETLRQECTFTPIRESEPKAKHWYSVVQEWRDWYEGYENSHLEFTNPEGETVRGKLTNSYQPEYGDKYYAKLGDLERGIEREYDSLTTAMLTFTCSSLNRQGEPRPAGDCMRDIISAWNTARKMLHKALSAYEWEYARVLEPHKSGYGHLHIAVFIDSDSINEQTFKGVMESYVDNCTAAGWEAHKPENSVSVNEEMDSLPSYVSKYIGQYGEKPTERDIEEQMFLAVTWATNTNRVDFSNGAQELITKERFRRETGLRPEDRGEVESDEKIDCEQTEALEGDSEGWDVKRIVSVTKHKNERKYSDPTSGGVEMVEIDGNDSIHLPAVRS
jgi:hypothetical protein